MSSPAAYSATVHSTRTLSRAAQPGTNAMDLPELLRSIKIAGEFVHYDETDLAIHGTWMTSHLAND